ncbi:MAG TPA: YihY/virulence factor BrkB family protein [Candidatus Limnocylindria bacterium]|nr:YihY/virulence factor BrkB family protein [Candidatus Limnocylindria bacterium]
MAINRVRGSVPARVVEKFVEDQAPNWAIIIAWNALFAMFPTVLVVAAILGIVLQVAGITTTQIYTRLLSLIPDPQTVRELVPVASGVKEHTGLLAVVGLIGLIWGGSALFGAMEQAFAIAYRVRPRSFIPGKLMSAAMIFLFTILAGVAVTTSSVLPALNQLPNVPAFLAGGAAAALQLVIGIAAGFILYLVIYFVVPNRRLGLGKVWPGALVAGILFEVVTLIFPIYLSLNKGLNAYGKTFGLFFLLMTFFYFVGLITMVGVEVNSVLHPVDAVRPALAAAAAPPNLAPESARPNRRGIRGRTVLLLAVVASGIGVLLGRRSSGKV